MATTRDILIRDYGTGTSNEVSRLMQDKSFNYNITRYPLDLGVQGSGRNHYIIFHILQQRESQYKSAVSGEGINAKTENERRGSYVNSGVASTTKAVNSIFNPTDPAKPSPTTNSQKENPPWYVPNSLYKVANFTYEFTAGAINTTVDNIQQIAENVEKVEFVRTVSKTKETIALYMPDTLNFVQGQAYEDLAMGNSLVTALFAGGQSVSDSIKKYSSGGMSARELGSQIATNASPFAINMLGNVFGNFGRAVAAAGQGIVTNPMIEVVYSSPALRSFRFDFMFYPQSQIEAIEVQKIIQLFQFHQAPEISNNNNGTNGYFLVPPSEFDIEFYHAGIENINIPSISTCVLTSMDVDYAPNGFSAYETGAGNKVEYGGTGMPVAIKMSLDFKETTMVFKSSRQFNRDTTNLKTSQPAPPSTI